MSVHQFRDTLAPQKASSPPLTPQYFPNDAHAVIYQPARSPMTSGRARTLKWKLRFERRTPSFVEPLMGWTGGDDPLAQVELSFPSVDSAIAYACRQGLNYTVQGMPQPKPALSVIGEPTDANQDAAVAHGQRLAWVERTLGPEVIRHGFGPGANPTEIYAVPQDVLRDTGLTADGKRDMLQRWALEAYMLDLAFSSGASEARTSHLQEVIDALIELDKTNPPRANDEHASVSGGAA